MKLKTNKSNKSNPLSLNSFETKLKLIRKDQFYNFKFNSKRIKSNLKNILNLIYKYHFFNKKILFLEFPKFFNETLKNTKHILIQEHFYCAEFIDNESNDFKPFFNKTRIPLNIIRTFLRLNKKVDLILIANLDEKYNPILKKSLKSKTPTITLCPSTLKTKCIIKPTYKILTNYESLNEKMLDSNFFFIMLKRTLKEAEVIRRSKSYERNLKHKFPLLVLLDEKSEYHYTNKSYKKEKQLLLGCHNYCKKLRNYRPQHNPFQVYNPYRPHSELKLIIYI